MHRFAITALLAALFATPAAAETRALSGFDTVHAEDRLRVEVAVGPRHSVEVTGDDAGRVRTRIDGDELRISDARRPWFGSGRRLDAVVRVTMPDVEGVSAARGAELEALLSGPCDDFSAAAAMGGSVDVEGIQCDAVEASAAMGADIRLEGACQSLNVSAAMGATVRAERLRCETVDASAAMGADVEAYARQFFDASSAMGGSINVAGDARSSSTSTSMGGSISSGNR